ncbi:MAG: sarcosine oxidase subunit alpha family protein [Rhodobacteraceae bacterium]|nr:sarcosine oxidase subunit alpha family protein [Paracoccaceae bacterium]
MSHRIENSGSLIDRSKPITFTFNGKKFSGFQGDTLASALLANGQVMVGRSFKYHRPRGLVASGAEEPNALMNMGEGARFEPNQRATTTELFDGLVAKSQNHWPSLEFDIGAINNRFPKFLPAGFYYKTFMYPRWAWKHVFEPIIRKSAGLGTAPQQPDADRYEYFYAYVDVLIIGGGSAGLTAALAAGKTGAKVLLVEQAAHLGGRAIIDGQGFEKLRADLAKMSNITIRTRTMGAGVYDHGYALAYERITDHLPNSDQPRHRLWRIRAKRIVTATGAIERALNFAGNDIPGVMLASAVRDYVSLWGVSPGKSTVIVTNNDDAYRTAITLFNSGQTVAAILDARPDGGGPLADQAIDLGIRVLNGKAIKKVDGYKSVTGVTICDQSDENSGLETIACDCVAMSGGWSPVVHLWSHCGGKLNWDAKNAMFAPDPNRPPTDHNGQGFVITAGAASGALDHDAGVQNAALAGRQAADEAGFTPSEEAAAIAAAPDHSPMLAVWSMPRNASYALRSKTWLDFQNDVKVSDVQLAAREGYESVEHTKRYTTLGMATDQGKLSNINGLAVLADSLDAEIPNVGTTTFRPPYTPISIGSIAGEARGPLFKPTRKSPIDAWQDANNAVWEPVADWRRPYAYRQSGETTAQAVTREINATRNSLGLLDASTLGKILVKGPDAGKFLDLIYTNMMSNLKQGRCRYGLMCNENGFLFDDGVVVRTGAQEFLCHTTSGGSDRVHAWMEEWLQTEWWDLQVYTANITEQFAQIAVVGPNARKVLEKLGGMDVSNQALPFMAYAEGKLAGIRARPYRISFSGELSFEIAVPANQGQEIWDKILDAGKEFNITPYGTEALHVMRAEKGFIMIGDETDGTVIPQDLNLGWAVSKKKSDFLGKRAQQRRHMVDQNRKQLVGLYTLDADYVLPDCAHAVENGKIIGHVSSSYYSPTLGRSIAMALIKAGAGRMDEVLDFVIDGKQVKAKVVDPVFLDKEGARQNV